MSYFAGEIGRFWLYMGLCLSTEWLKNWGLADLGVNILGSVNSGMEHWEGAV